MVAIGSRFCSGAESRYSPVEGEMLAVAYGLEKTHMWTLGNPTLRLVVDHKPLLGLLKSRDLGDIASPRLGRLVEKTLRWNFLVDHIPGKHNSGSDALSRLPWTGDTSLGCLTGEMAEEPGETALIGAAVALEGVAVSMAEVVKETSGDAELQAVMQHLRGSRSHKDWEDSRPFFRHRSDLWECDGALLLGQRIVIPGVLRERCLRALHAAHQGVEGMTARARSSVWWPGIL